jgi:hypothetical protein
MTSRAALHDANKSPELFQIKYDVQQEVNEIQLKILYENQYGNSNVLKRDYNVQDNDSNTFIHSVKQEIQALFPDTVVAQEKKRAVTMNWS